ncbi:glycosyltransferase involved in cell wall biosynthesis [Homoserinimonas aerilata]|uniref:Glycosyltransferase involved in cell wall biosynthesis n=1 Tax=Homoserinimonas aerilata TaxID=1162970 RepID=A0A542YIY0_9MICO|nr:glycosyltransferase family 1 protein [Homoserinimonas aerilata]TQL48055.1 glycosyltransferase involved in cell wall biosynthesis [Homoserinimonas aerilata]
MKIVFDCRYTRLERHDGISRYTAELVTALARLTPVTMLISDERQLTMLPDLPWIMGTDPTSLREPWVSRIVARSEPDVVFTPMQTMGSVGRRYRFILTLHDLIYYSNRRPPREFSWPVRMGWRVYHLSYLPVRMLLARADAVVTGSFSSRDEIVAARLTSRPITVVRSAVDAPKPEASERARPTRKELVYMGSFMPYKNVETIARALWLLPGYRLRLLSRVLPRERARLERIAPSGSLLFHDGVSDEEYLRILASATALVSASRQEGFGIPLVESMAAGTPVVVSDIPVFHEIGGEAAHYFAPDDERALAEAVLRLDMPGEWERHSLLSVAAAAEFSWEHSARTLYELALSLVGATAEDLQSGETATQDEALNETAAKHAN